ncbi:MAG: hypothetical protein ACR2P5_01055 [Gammaproteobacteria bacterium]
MESKFQFSASKRIAVLLAAGGASALAGILLIITLPPPLRIALACAVAVLFAGAIRRYAFVRGPRAVRAVSFLRESTVEITDGNEKVWRGDLEHARISPLLTIFTVRCGKQTFSIMADDGSMHPDLHRQLRVRLALAKTLPPTSSVFSAFIKSKFPAFFSLERHSEMFSEKRPLR